MVSIKPQGMMLTKASVTEANCSRDTLTGPIVPFWEHHAACSKW